MLGSAAVSSLGYLPSSRRCSPGWYVAAGRARCARSSRIAQPARLGIDRGGSSQPMADGRAPAGGDSAAPEASFGARVVLVGLGLALVAVPALVPACPRP